MELDRECYCGSQSFNFSETSVYACCNEGPCFEDNSQDVHCNGSMISFLNHFCHGECAQSSKFGYTLLPCKQKDQCYVGVAACTGTPKCDS